LFIIALGLLMIYPIVWMIVSSFKPNNMIFSDPGIIPKAVTIDNYITGWRGYAGSTFGRFFANSLMMCAVAVVGNLISCSMAAYAFARLKFAGRSFWFTIMMITLMLPGHVTLVPRYIMFNTFGWVGSYLPILVPKFLATDAFFVFLLVQFMRTLPKEVEEAAIIDGCGKIGVYLRIIIPLAIPALVTTALFTFLWTWDDFFNHLLYPHQAGFVHCLAGLGAPLSGDGGRGFQTGAARWRCPRCPSFPPLSCSLPCKNTSCRVSRPRVSRGRLHQERK
jgi:multiple sugar transport system permease protein